MDFIMGRIIGLYLELDVVCIAFVAQLEISIDESIGDAASIVENDGLFDALPHQFEVILVIQVAIAVYGALED